MWTSIFSSVDDHVSFVIHTYLLAGDVLATITVGAGIVWESIFDLRSIAHRLVVWGVVAETLCSVALFTFDEGVSGAQQAKIISLEGYIGGRHLTKEQFDAIQSLKGKMSGILIMPEDHCPECFNFADQLAVAFRKAGIQTMLHFAEIHGSGDICVYQSAPYSDLVKAALGAGDIRANLCPILPPEFWGKNSILPPSMGAISVPEAPPFPSMEKPYFGSP